jgi:uncharacterized membrane protein (UPF0127 family)
LQVVKIFLIIVFVLAIILIAVFMLINNFQAKQPLKNSKVCINNNCFNVELAENNYQLSRGLMFCESLAENKGMLFIFNKEAIHPFWMKNTLIALDIIWINAENKIVFISEDAQPCKTLLCPQIAPNQKARYVLEINAGLTSKLGIKIGDIIIK